ncbi:MAG: hemerythrin domain-containing protein [Acidimicrobiia bacterium]|nr:hemerythrin domain-containing protein [Acidimicrobiia bacterium]
MPDAITLLESDHEVVEGLFKQFEAAGPKAYKAKQKIVDKIIRELAVHAAVEEMVFYPATRELSPDVEDHVLESLEEHHVVKWILSELDGMDPQHERYDAKVTVLMESVRHHVEEEEKEYFPQVRKLSDRPTLEEMGEVLASAKKVAPTRPHPRSPDEPPANLANLAAGLLDRIRDTVSGRS